jgi:hypothetical protein
VIKIIELYPELEDLYLQSCHCIFDMSVISLSEGCSLYLQYCPKISGDCVLRLGRGCTKLSLLFIENNPSNIIRIQIKFRIRISVALMIVMIDSII